MKFHSPYQFIAIKKCDEDNKTAYSDQQDLQKQSNAFVRHDYWHNEGYSGRIHCTLKTESPLVIGGTQIAGTKDKPGVVIPYPYKNEPDVPESLARLKIPANSLRGMVANIAETLSQSSLRVLSSEQYSSYTVRKNVKDPIKKMAVLYKKGEEFYLYPLSEVSAISAYGDSKNINDAQFIKAAKTFQNKNSVQFVYATRSNNGTVTDLSYELDTKKIKGVLYIRGEYIDTKKKESFIEWDGKIDETKGIKVTEQVKAQEITLRQYEDKDDPDNALPQGYKRDWKKEGHAIVQAGDLLYFNVENNTVTELSYSQIWRKAINSNLYKALLRITNDQDVLPWNSQRNKLTPAETLFGVVEDEPDKDKPARNLASRIQFTEAVTTKPQGVKLQPEVILKILDSPKPPSPSMYFYAAKGKPIYKRELDLKKHNPNGRKHYLPQPEANDEITWKSKFNKNNPPKSKEGKTNWSQYLKCKPIPQETEFSFDIHFENLSKVELGLLQIALQPTNNDDFIHRLGLGKPLGLGQIKLKIDKTYRVKRTERYSLKGLQQASELEFNNEADDSLIDPQTWEDLKTLYNPANIIYPVCYPFNGKKGQSPYGEKEGFSWFEENEKASYKAKQQLKRVTANSEIPVLNDFKQN